LFEPAKRAVAAAFLLNGFAYASWVSRIPNIREKLEVSATGVALLLVALSVGTLTALPLSGWVVSRLGTRRTVLTSGGAVCGGLALMIVGLALGSPSYVGVAMFVYGAGTSTWDVAMNVEGARVERRLGRSVMPRFHAAFSIGTIVGAGLGALSAARDWPLLGQLAATGLLVAVTLPVATRRFLVEEPTPSAGQGHTSLIRAWTERRTLAIGLLVLSFALCEGLANDWLALTLVDAYGTSEAVGALAFAAFVSAMTLGRTVGGSFVDRYGRVVVLRVTALLVVAGAVTVAASPHPAGATLGAVLWGLGASLGFPLGMTAAADDETRAAARVSVVGSIGYAAFLGGPPVAGFLADVGGFRQAVLLAVVAAASGFVLATATKRTVPAAVSD
jgi:MFS family permease